MADDGIFSDLCRFAVLADELEDRVEEACAEIFGMIFAAVDYDPKSLTMIVYDVPRKFRARPEQLEAVWKLGARRLRTESRHDPQKLGRPEVWYYYVGGPLGGTDDFGDLG